jgi:hypothetical protein
VRSNDIISFLMVDGVRSNVVITFLMGTLPSTEVQNRAPGTLNKNQVFLVYDIYYS